MIKPTGYYVLIKMEKVEKVSEGGIIMYSTNNEHQIEQGGHSVGVLIALGPTAYCGYAGCDIDELVETTAESRALRWGVKVGDKVEFQAYDGKIPTHPDYKDYRFIQDGHVLGCIED